MSNVADDAFGRWLEERIKAWREIGVEAERNRIIKLLEAEKEGLLKIALSSDNPELLEQAKVAHTGISLAIGVITAENE